MNFLFSAEEFTLAKEILRFTQDPLLHAKLGMRRPLRAKGRLRVGSMH